MESTIRLFKAIEIKSKRKKNPSKKLLEATIKKGFIFSPEVVANCSNIMGLIKMVEKEMGLTAEQLNNSFHKSWAKIKDASMEQLVIEQIIHYITTYGFEKLGVYNEDSVYIPHEKLEIPELKEDIKLIIIRGYTKKELKDKLLNLVNSGIALKEETINDIIDVANLVELKTKEIDLIKNREVKIRLYDKLKKIPENPVEFLRCIIYKITGKSLLIKSNSLIDEIKSNDSKHSYNLLKKYKKEFGLKKLSEVFYRFKPLFLSLKDDSNKTIINKIRKLAKKNHKPLIEDYLNSITSKIKNKKKINQKELEKELNKVNIFRKIRLAYALNYRTKDTDSILYRIRNGRGYSTEFDFKNKKEAKRVLNIVLNSIIKDIKKNVKGKKIYIPQEINYTLPTTEKQFTGNFPSGTYISIPKDMIVGVHWENVGGHRIDLDLSLLDVNQKIGWDSSYRTKKRDVLFSGDITNASRPNGASELFYVKRQIMNPYIMNLNYYNHDEGVQVPFSIIVAKEEAKNFKQNYMINPNNIITMAKSKISQKQMIIGLLVPTTNGNKFYFAETAIGASITSSNSDFIENTKKYLLNFYGNTIKLKDILEKAGAKIVKNKEKCDIDLSPEELERDTILNLIK